MLNLNSSIQRDQTKWHLRYTEYTIEEKPSLFTLPTTDFKRGLYSENNKYVGTYPLNLHNNEFYTILTDSTAITKNNDPDTYVYNNSLYLKRLELIAILQSRQYPNPDDSGNDGNSPTNITVNDKDSTPNVGK
jgi:hypothetical protein